MREGAKSQGEYSPAVIKEDIDRDAALVLDGAGAARARAPGHRRAVTALPQRARCFHTSLGIRGPISAEEHAELGDEGYLLQDFIGKTGVESTYEDVLRGKPGKKLIEVDAAGRELKVDIRAEARSTAQILC